MGEDMIRTNHFQIERDESVDSDHRIPLIPKVMNLIPTFLTQRPQDIFAL
jgi:hypothetical protein